MIRSPKRTSWQKEFDNKPTIDVPRIQFCHKFSEGYLENTNRVLEIGCGIGSYMYFIDNHVNIGVDIQFSALEVAKKYCTKTEFIVASALHLPFKSCVFDLICIWGLIEELPKGTERKAFLECRRIMVEDAKLLLSAYNKTLISKIFDPAIILTGLRQYDSRELINLLAELGFSLKEYTIKGNWYTLIGNNIFLFCKHVLHRKDCIAKKYFDMKSDKEFNSSKLGKLYTFIAVEKK